MNVKSDIRYIHLTETDSTNKFLRHFPDDGFRMTVVSTDFQTAGKGQGRNSWESERGKNLVFSVLIHPSYVSASRQFILSMAISLAIKFALQTYMENVTIKWPNDIYYQNKKICGILIENNLSGTCIKDSILGVGVDVNQRVFRSDAPNPVSMFQIIGHDTDVPMLLKQIINKFDELLWKLEKSAYDDIRRCYISSLYRRDGVFSFRDSQGVFLAEIVTVENDGHLVLLDVNLQKRVYAFKEVAFVINE